MSTTGELVELVINAFDHGDTVEIDGLPGRDLCLVDNGRGECIIGTRRRPGADSPDVPLVMAETLQDVKARLDLAHRLLHEDDVAGAHRALHEARSPRVPWPGSTAELRALDRVAAPLTFGELCALRARGRSPIRFTRSTDGDYPSNPWHVGGEEGRGVWCGAYPTGKDCDPSRWVYLLVADYEPSIDERCPACLDAMLEAGHLPVINGDTTYTER